MARKSLVQRAEIDQAGKSHNCQASSRHRVHMGDRRLKVHIDRSCDHYCSECAIKIIEADIVRLQELLGQFQSSA